jgi:hypothetical protein
MDTLKLATATTLNLENLTRNQTVQPIQQVEIFQLQGASSLTLSANDVLSLGGSNASTMSAFTFTSTSGGTGSATSTGKVQFVVNGTSTDTVNLAVLENDAVLTSGVLGNTGLAGVWNDMGTTQIGPISYHVYNHSTTQAQVLVAGAAVNTPASSQSVSITRADSSAAAVNYVEEFNAGTGTTAVNTFASTIDTQAWSITAIDFLSANALVPELKLTTGASATQTWVNTGMGTDAKLVIGPDTGAGNSNEPRLNVFTSKAGVFSAISFNYIELNSSYAHNTNGGSLVKFYDASGSEINSTVFAVPLSVGTGTLGTYTYALPTGVTASSFSIETNTNDQWFMDGLTMTTAASSYLANTSATVDSTPLLSGTYTNNLNVGDVVKVYDGSTYVGTATVDSATKTWTLQLTTPQAVGSHSYVAKIESSTSTTLATSNNYSLNTLSKVTVAPIVMDLNGDGQIAYSQVQMDMNNDGVLDNSAWVAGNDGVLVLDQYGDGSVRNTSQFAFARNAGETDLQGLAAQYDSNHDGVFNSLDTQFAEFAVWQDADQNGVAGTGEVKHLADLGITSINLNSNGIQATPAQGVSEAGRTTAELADGSTMVVADAAFSYQIGTADPINTSIADWLDPQNANHFDMTGSRLADGSTTANSVNLTINDLLNLPVDANGLQAARINGDANDTVNLDNLLGSQESWVSQGSVVQDGVSYSAYSVTGHEAIQVLIDNQIQNVNIG